MRSRPRFFMGDAENECLISDWVKDRVTIDELAVQFNISRRSILRILEADDFVLNHQRRPLSVIRLAGETSIWNHCWSSPRIYRRWWREGFEPKLKYSNEDESTHATWASKARTNLPETK